MMVARDSDRETQRGYLISGRVQGVGFRHWTTRNARELGLRGTVRNRPDGRVELHVAGDTGDVWRIGSRRGPGPPGSGTWSPWRATATSPTNSGSCDRGPAPPHPAGTPPGGRALPPCARVSEGTANSPTRRTFRR
ncbi:MAG: acylphosphatase [Gemmatimonadota bacterium]